MFQIYDGFSEESGVLVTVDNDDEYRQTETIVPSGFQALITFEDHPDSTLVLAVEARRNGV